VPVDATKPAGPTLDIAVTIRRTNATTWTSPVVVLGVAEPRFFVSERYPGHDVVGVDSRGLGRSGPSTACPELKDYQAEINTRNLQPAGVAAVRACVGKLASGPASAAALLDGGARANDVATVRRSLGIDKWAIHTARGSADITMHLLATDTSAITMVIAYTPFTVGTGLTPNSEKEAFDRFAADCAGIPTCAAKGDMQALLEKLVSLPPVTTKTIEPATGWPIVLDAVTARGGIAAALSRSALAAVLPGLLGGEASGGANEVIAGFYNSTPANWGATDPMALCQDLGFAEAPLKGGNDDHAGPFKGESVERMCDAIGPQPQMSAPPKSTGTIPVLVVVPSYENQGSEAGAKAIFAGYSNLNVVVVPGSPGDTPEFVSCFAKTASAFADAPTAKLDTSCLTSRDWVKFA
jgi:pimeloyl-ACP methyl ester carboxylesterase